jgi:putative NADH-flavin reductase
MSALKIAIIGASGNVGSKLVNEAIARGHTVTGIVRHPQALIHNEHVVAKKGDIRHTVELAETLAGHDVVISTVKFQEASVNDLLKAVKNSGVKRLLVVGGAGSLEVAPGKALIDTPEFPEVYKPEASAGREWLKVLRKEGDLSWTFLSPSALFIPGERTGKFRLGKDQLLVAENGESSISMEDYAIAMLDEVENPKHIRERFTVGY